MVRRIGSVLYNVECRTLFDLPVWDVNGTPKVFSRDVAGQLNLQEDGDLIDLEFIVRCTQLGVQILEVPIVSAVRHGGESTTNYYSAVRMYWGAFKMQRAAKQWNRMGEAPRIHEAYLRCGSRDFVEGSERRVPRTCRNCGVLAGRAQDRCRLLECTVTGRGGKPWKRRELLS